ncbi:MAG: hypothetical protein AAGF12_27630, partial [Myxococcota bacterium]
PGRFLRRGAWTIEAAVRQFAEQTGADFLDPELLMPCHRTVEGSILCFDRSAGPVSDTWSIVDYYEDTGETRLVFRTFDGWCRLCVAEWDADDFGAEFSLDKYLRQGERHAAMEPDVSTAHATVAHAYRRAGQPEKALESYLRAARCVPSLLYCDWEALKLAVLLGRPGEALEAASRLCSRAPSSRWRERETTPAQVADVIGKVAVHVSDPSVWIRLLDQLEEQAEGAEKSQAHAVRRAVVQRGTLPPPRRNGEPAVAPHPDPTAWWQAVQKSYYEGALRDEDLLLDPQLASLGQRFDFQELLRIRRDF